MENRGTIEARGKHARKWNGNPRQGRNILRLQGNGANGQQECNDVKKLKEDERTLKEHGRKCTKATQFDFQKID